MVPYHQRQGGASVSVRSPTVRGARTKDLRAELNSRRTGEDARFSVKRARERRLNIEGRNLNADLDAAAPKPPGNARIQAGTPVAGVGCAALAEHLPRGGVTIQVPPAPAGEVRRYREPVGIPAGVRYRHHTAAGGNDAIMASYFHIALTGPARTWLMNLIPGTIQSWEELCARFTANFASAY